MNSKTKIIITAATALGLALGASGIIGYRSIDEQWQLLELSKLEFSKAMKNEQINALQREAQLTKREKIADQQIKNSVEIASLAKETERESKLEMITAKKLEITAVKTRKEAISQQELAAGLIKEAKQQKSEASIQQIEFRNAKAKTEAEFIKAQKLQSRLNTQIKSNQHALTKTKKAESNAIWYQNKAKKSIAQAECDISEADRRSREANDIHEKAKRVFHQISTLECALEDKCDEIEKLVKKQKKLVYNIKENESKHRNKIDYSLRDLKRQNNEFCTKISKQKSSIMSLKQKFEKSNSKNNKQKSIISTQKREIKKLESVLRENK